MWVASWLCSHHGTRLISVETGGVVAVIVNSVQLDGVVAVIQIKFEVDGFMAVILDGVVARILISV